MTDRIRKAWMAWPKGYAGGDLDVFFSSTAAKARYQAWLSWSDCLDSLRLIDITVRRWPERDVTLPPPHRLLADLSDRQKRIISHAFGVDRHGNGYRDHYCTAPGNADILPLCFEFGLFTGPAGERAYGETPGWSGAFFYLTDLGKAVAKSMLPTYPDEARHA